MPLSKLQGFQDRSQHLQWLWQICWYLWEFFLLDWFYQSLLCCWLFLTGPESNKLLYVMIKNRNLAFRFIACCGFNEPDVNGEKNRPHLNILISFTGRRLTQRGWARRGLKSHLTPPLPVHAHCVKLNWAWSLPEIVTSKSQIRDVLGNGADRFSSSS